MAPVRRWTRGVSSHREGFGIAPAAGRLLQQVWVGGGGTVLTHLTNWAQEVEILSAWYVSAQRMLYFCLQK